MKNFLKSVAGAAAIAFSMPSSAATLIIDGNGQLTGAQGVDVGGTLYDVEFVDGTCAAVFNGCNGNSDFAISNEATALLAGQALFDQVLIDTPLGAFDSSAALTRGCSDTDVCSVLTAYGVSGSTNGDTLGVFSQNAPDTNSFLLDPAPFSRALPAFFDSTVRGAVWARFSSASAVPEPGTWLMMILGFGAIGGMMRGRSGEARKQNASMRVRYR
jgi:hypothetical protein